MSSSGSKPRKSASRGKPRALGTLTLDPGISVNHLLLRRDEVGSDQVDALVAEFLQRTRVRRRTARMAVVLWRGQFDTEPPTSWPYWSLAIEAVRVAWYRDLQAAAAAVRLSPALGMSTPGGPDGIGATPYLLFDGGNVAVFDQRRKINSAAKLTLAGRTFDVRTVQYRYPQTRVDVAVDTPENSDDLAERLVGTVHLAEIRGRSPLKIWDQAHESLVALSHRDDSAELPYDDAVAICESIGIPVVETSMIEYGRLVIEPLWGVNDKGRWIEDCRVTIAVRSGLPAAQKRLALLHELGHYTHHLRYLATFLILYYRIAQNPGLEAVIAEQFPATWHLQRNQVMELDADLFSACFVVPHKVSGWLRDLRSPVDRVTVKRVILELLHRVFDDHWSVGRIGQDRLEGAWREIAESNYDVAGSWFDRLAHCVALRGSERLLDLVNEGVRLERDMEKLAEIMARPSANEGAGSSRFLERCSEAEIAAAFSVPDRWDPVLLEPRGGEPAAGYLPLRPMFTKGDGVDVYDWSRADGYAAGFAGTIEDWRQEAEANGCGLMLFPMHSVEHALRRRYA